MTALEDRASELDSKFRELGLIRPSDSRIFLREEFYESRGYQLYVRFALDKIADLPNSFFKAVNKKIGKEEVQQALRQTYDELTKIIQKEDEEAAGAYPPPASYSCCCVVM
jgi:hypothetical protein